MATLRSRNREWGFFGTFQSSSGLSDRRVGIAFATAQRELRCIDPSLTAEAARDLLDSTFGRHLADGVEGQQPGAIVLPVWTGKELRRLRRRRGRTAEGSTNPGTSCRRTEESP